MVKYKAGPNTRKEPGAGGGSNRTKRQIAADDMAMAIGKKLQGALGGRTISDQDIRLIKNALSLDKKKYGGKTKKAKGMAKGGKMKAKGMKRGGKMKAKGMAKGGKTRMAMKSKGYAKGGKTIRATAKKKRL
jgi:hypothetical protein